MVDSSTTSRVKVTSFHSTCLVELVSTVDATGDFNYSDQVNTDRQLTHLRVEETKYHGNDSTLQAVSSNCDVK